MACGCQAKQTPASKDAAAMCCACPHAREWTTCTIDGRPMLERPCPLGRHPDANGVVVWRGLEWYGVPAPIRWSFKLRFFRFWYGCGSNLGELQGCGCLKVLKDLFGK